MYYIKKMDPHAADHVKRSIPEYTQSNSEMGENRGSQGIKGLWEKKFSATDHFIFTYLKAQLTQSWK